MKVTSRVLCDRVSLAMDLVDLGNLRRLGRDELVAQVDVLLEVRTFLLSCVKRRQQLGSGRQISLHVLHLSELFDVLLLVSEGDNGLSEVILDLLGLLSQLRLLRELIGQKLRVHSSRCLRLGLLTSDSRFFRDLGVDDRRVRVFVCISVLNFLKYLLRKGL